MDELGLSTGRGSEGGARWCGRGKGRREEERGNWGGLGEEEREGETASGAKEEGEVSRPTTV